MKNIQIYIIALAGLIMITSCQKNFLDRNPLDQLSQSTFWKTQNDADLALAGCYNFLCKGYNATGVTAAGAGWGGGSMFWETIADNGYTISSGSSFANISTGVIESTTGGMQSDAYTYTYQGIAACNIFLANIGKVPLTAQLRNQYIGEVKFLRAYHYFFLSQIYGDVVLTLSPLSGDMQSSTFPRTAKSIVVDSVLADLNFAASNLPNTAYSGHVVRGTALGYITKVLLANNKWHEAATTAKTIMTENQFSLYTGGYNNLFLKPGQNGNPEIMFSARYLPPNFYSPADWLYSYLNTVQVLSYLVNDYECTDGLPISSSPLYNAATPYANRDPRLKFTVIVPGDLRGTSASTAFDPVKAAVPSGFLPRKGVDPTRFPTTYATQSDQDWVFLRYADILLMYAEAQNEDVGPDISVYSAINSVRSRPGVNMPPLIAGLSQAVMRTKIQHERRIEFALEGQRYFELKRWKLDRTIIPTVKDPNNAFRTFALRDTLWPVPQSEIDIAKSFNNTGFKQTPGY
ncbi:MAG: RagB/SusD family nutrient uptake outer membrane protein [Mucilaginibacter sp.]|uniref:RagB/SusD family nutrient uptake outer membrane protein n=1 Tax=Mucilaginibacter sp. TaxID=1882438 RepID=UPI0032661740